MASDEQVLYDTENKGQVTYDAETDEGQILYEAGSPPNATLLQLIQFQHGPIQENGRNGIQNEDVLQLLLYRMDALQERFPCDENVQAIQGMKHALDWLNARTEKRRAQGVEGLNIPHNS